MSSGFFIARETIGLMRPIGPMRAKGTYDKRTQSLAKWGLGGDTLAAAR